MDLIMGFEHVVVVCRLVEPVGTARLASMYEKYPLLHPASGFSEGKAQIYPVRVRGLKPGRLSEGGISS